MPDEARSPNQITPDMLPENWSDLTREERRQVWLNLTPLSEQEFDDLLGGLKERQKYVPNQGAGAPDFELDVLDRTRGRTGEKVRLSDLRGKPVGLIFGSYT